MFLHFAAMLTGLLAVFYPLQKSLAGPQNEISKQSVVVGLDHWPPFGIESDPPRGISAEIIQAVFRRAGYHVEIKYLPWLRVEKGVQDQTLDVMGNLYYTKKIAEWADYSEPYLNSRVRFAVRNEFSKSIQVLRDAAEQRIAVGLGYSYGADFDDADYLKKVYVPGIENGLKMLVLERVDMVIDSEESLLYHLHKEPSFQPSVKLLELVVKTHPMSIGVSKNHPRAQQLIKDFNRELEVLNKQGILREIIARNPGSR